MTKKLNILCIDDSKSVHAFLSECLKDWSESISHAYNGMEAINILKEKPNAFDLIFLDWEMPVKDGPTTFGEIKALNIRTPVFMLTTKNSPDEILHMLDEGVTEYIMKPFTQEIISEKIQMHLG